MKQSNIIHYFLLGMVLLAASGAQAELPEYSLHYDPARNPFVDGRAAIKLAKQTNKNIMIEIGGDWCTWCHVLDRFIKSDPEITKKLHENFVVLKINVGDGNKNEDFMDSFPRVYAYPHIFFANKNGTTIHSQDTAEFFSDGKYSKPLFLEILDRWRPKEDQP